ncbi:MAG TPA: adenylate/guanylate cyclase domain-containing protein [Spirochaetia bacterium]|nr:adenylate/guanylate cyclase domain-containing protein [Spirochaetia bacterium]
MSIRAKIVFVVLPLIIAPLLITGVISAFSARNGITQVATEFLRFKMDALISYAGSQWGLLVENEMEDRPDFIDATKLAVESFAGNLIRSPTELILAINESGQVALKTGDVQIAADETRQIAKILSENLSGWQQIKLGAVERVAQIRRFEPFKWVLFATERQDTFYRTINQMFWQTGFIIGAASGVSIALLLVFSYFLIKPLRNIAGAMRGIISTNDLSKRVEVLYKDETGDLGHTFNIMAGELDKAYEQVKGYALKAVVAQHREQKIRNIFQKYVPKDVIDQFFTNPEGMLIGEDRILAVLFSDIRGFTSLSEKMLPNEVVESLNEYFTIMVDIIMRHRGIVDKYMGDAIMAFYGAPVRHRDEALQAVQSGFEMIDALRDFNIWQEKRNRPQFNIGVGINYGVVTVGNIGSDKKMDYTVVGDMVNLASRLEGLTKKYKEHVIVSESVYRYVEKEVPCRMLDKVIVKGKTAGVGVYTPRKSLKPAEREGWELHQQALEHYYKREFEEAKKNFLEVQRILKNDTCSQVFLQRCEQYLVSAPPPAWNGAVTMDEK